MSDGQRPPRRPRRPPNVPKPPTKPKGFEDVPELSDEEVERRVAVTGGGAPHEPVQRPVRRVPPPPKERTVARDSLLLIGLVIVGLVAVAFLLPNGPLTASATNPPGSEAAVATTSPTRAPTPAPSATTAVVQEPSPSTEATATDVPSVGPTVAPIPTPTLKPGETPRPTPKVTPVPTPKPTPPPGSPTLNVIVTVSNTHGGLAAPSTWLLAPHGVNASPTSFLGSSSGTIVTIAAGAAYYFDVTPQAPEGNYYTAVWSTNCRSAIGGVLAAGQHYTCNVIFYDHAAQVTVFTHVNGPDGASAWNVSVTASGVSPSGAVSGSETGVAFTFDAHASFDVVQTGPGGYDPPDISGSCNSGSGLIPGATVTCSYTFNQTPPPPTDSPPPTVPMLVFLAFPLPRRWRLIRR